MVSFITVHAYTRIAIEDAFPKKMLGVDGSHPLLRIEFVVVSMTWCLERTAHFCRSQADSWPEAEQACRNSS
jgi:hypothetical protein